jgi:ribosome-binding factor A|tara:strand:- start:350 stop:748 length:399 start_codon:yes stop_codon:yes gene_type:complete
MIKQNDIKIFKIPRKNSRIEKLTQLIKKTLGEIFLNQDFRDSKGNNLLIFIDEVVLSKDGKIATVFLTNFSKKNNLSENESLGLIDNNLIRIKKEFSEKIVLRYTPKLKFRFDYLRRQSFEVDKLIEGLSKT